MCWSGSQHSGKLVPCQSTGLSYKDGARGQAGGEDAQGEVWEMARSSHGLSDECPACSPQVSTWPQLGSSLHPVLFFLYGWRPRSGGLDPGQLVVDATSRLSPPPTDGGGAGSRFPTSDRQVGSPGNLPPSLGGLGAFHKPPR